ncbi:phosphatase PAP2 family protein [Streptomyces spiramenti]|uniref:Phosphatase PAP2 family protein n=1 Tax=Streptomyces spiramenti TaxID=2720606 RepID=A0ABX1ALT5_9ACTN|nr:phosphatase PAP2 family protein [Streptomyces spiramenti]NJP65432.1 phosphatase PAP2 family protein [Streptomyces spiramenti]
MNPRGAAVPSSVPALTAVVAALALAALTVLVLRAGEPFAPDRAALAWSVDHRPDTARQLVTALTHTGSGPLPYAMVVAAGYRAGRATSRPVVWAAGFLAALLGGQLLRFLLMTAVARTRPPEADWALHVSRHAFPSGHTATAAMAAALVVAALLIHADGRTGAVDRAAGFLALWTVAVGASRVYLGVHWFTDVVGGWLFATAWIGALALLWQRRHPGGPLDPAPR